MVSSLRHLHHSLAFFYGPPFCASAHRWQKMAAQPLLFMTSHFKPNSFFIPYRSRSLALSLSLLIGLAYASFFPLWSSEQWPERLGSCREQQPRLRMGGFFQKGKRVGRKWLPSYHMFSCSTSASSHFFSPSHYFQQGQKSPGNSLFPPSKIRLSYLLPNMIPQATC